MSIGSNIKKYRKIKGMTQKELANELGISKVSIQKYETNKREPRYITVSDIAKVLEVSTSDLYSDGRETIDEVVQVKEIDFIDSNTDLSKIIKDYRNKVGISYSKLAESIGISKSTLEDIVYGFRPGKDSTREKIYNYIVANDVNNKILNIYRGKEHIKRILGIYKTMHNVLGLVYVVELINNKDDIIYEVLLEREVV